MEWTDECRKSISYKNQILQNEKTFYSSPPRESNFYGIQDPFLNEYQIWRRLFQSTPVTKNEVDLCPFYHFQLLSLKKRS